MKLGSLVALYKINVLFESQIAETFGFGDMGG
jgi:hypothetical protein